MDTDAERTLCEKGLNTFGDSYVNAFCSLVHAQLISSMPLSKLVSNVLGFGYSVYMKRQGVSLRVAVSYAVIHCELSQGQ